MKKVYEALYPIGYVENEVADNFTVEVPYTEVKPLELTNPQSQYYDFAERTWKEAVTQDYSAKLDLLENISAGLTVKNNQLEQENAELKKSDQNQSKEITDTQVAVSEVFELVLGGETK